MGRLKAKAKVAQSCPILCDPMDYTVHGILLARILESVAFSFSNLLLLLSRFSRVQLHVTP